MDTLSVVQYGFAPALAAVLLHSLWQNALLALASWLVLAALQRSSAACRHTVAMLFLLAMVLVPAMEFLRFWQLSAVRISASWMPALTAPQVEAIPGVFVQESQPLAGILVASWLFGVALMLLRLLGGWRFIGRLEYGSWQPLPDAWQQRARSLRQALGISREVMVRLAHDVAAPFTARLLRPVIWLPVSLLTRLPAEQIEALLAHELAHVRRLDWAWNALQCVIESLLFFHPGVWWLSRRIRREREHACDDLAAVACGNAIALAEALTELARQRHSFPQLLLTAHGGSLMHRITRLLSGPPARGRWGARAGLVVLLASGVLLVSQVGLTGNRPNLRIESTTDGVLGPGDVREITANGLDKQRYYRGSVDAQGRLSEVYKEDGQLRPMGDNARAWLTEVMRLSAPPPPAPESAPSPPPSGIADSATFKTLLPLVAAEPRVIAQLGAPVFLTSNRVRGHIYIGNGSKPDGDAELRFRLGGPKGRARMQVAAALTEGAWALESVNLTPANP